MRRTNEQWRELVAEFETTNLSHAAFAERCDVHVGTFRSWLYRIRRESTSGVHFAEVVVDTQRSMKPDDGCVVRLTDGVELELASVPGPAWLAELCRAMAGAS